MTLTPLQHGILDRLDRDPAAFITDSDKRACPGIHFCPDWDELPVCFDSPEIEGCTCALKERL